MLVGVQWDGFGAHHVDYVPWVGGWWLVVRDGRESCALTKSRVNYRCARPERRHTEECQRFWEDPLAYGASAAAHRRRQYQRLRDGLPVEHLEELGEEAEREWDIFFGNAVRMPDDDDIATENEGDDFE